MGMENLYREVMDLNMMDDNDQKEAAAKAFFEKLNFMTMPEYFNWAEEIFEGLHVKERGDKKALIWADIHHQRKQNLYLQGICRPRQPVPEQPARGRRRERRQHVYDAADHIRRPGLPVTPASRVVIVAVPTATSMTLRELEFRFETYPPTVDRRR